jgi:TP901 family phage tail tape measure protein
MAGKDEVKIKVSLFNQDFNKSMKEMSSESSKLNREFKLQQEQMKNTATDAEKLAAKVDFLNKKQELAKQKVAETEKQYEAAVAQYGENSVAAQDLAKKLDSARIEEQQLANQLHETNQEIKNQKSELEKTGENLKEFGGKVTDAGKVMSVGVTAPIMAIGAAGVAASKDYNDAFNTVIKKTGATGKAAEDLEKSFRKVIAAGPDTFGDVGQAVGEVNTQFGFLGATLEDMSDLMLQFATINGQDVTSTSIAAKKAIEAYGLSNKDLESVLDAVTKTAQNTGQSTKDLFDKAVAGAPQIKALGLTFAEGTALIGNFEKSGVDSAAALGYLSKASIVFAKDGKTLEQGLSETVKKISESKSETEALTIASEVFGAKGASKMVDAIKRGTFNLKDFSSAGKDAERSVRTTFEQSLKPTDQAAIAYNNAKLALADVGNAIQVALMPFLQKATKVLQELAQWFGNLSPHMKQVILIVGGILAAIGPLLVIIGTVISSIGSIIGVFAPLAAAIAEAGGLMAWLGPVFAAITGPISLIILAVIGLIAIFVALWKNNEDFRNAVLGIWESIKIGFQLALDFIWNIVQSVMSSVLAFFGEVLGKIKAFWSENGTAIMSIVMAYLSYIWSNIQMVMGLIRGIFEVVWPIISGVVQVAWALIKTSIKNAIDLILGIIQFFVKAFTGDWNGAWETVKQTTKNMMENILSTFKGIDLAKIGKDIVQGLINGLGSMVDAVKERVKSLSKLIPDGLKDFLGIHSPSRVMMELGEYTGEGLLVGVEKKIADAKKMAAELAKAITPSNQSINSEVAAVQANIPRQLLIQSEPIVKTGVEKVEQNITINSLSPLSPSEIAREQMQVSRRLAMEWG